MWGNTRVWSRFFPRGSVAVQSKVSKASWPNTEHNLSPTYNNQYCIVPNKHGRWSVKWKKNCKFPPPSPIRWIFFKSLTNFKSVADTCLGHLFRPTACLPNVDQVLIFLLLAFRNFLKQYFWKFYFHYFV